MTTKPKTRRRMSLLSGERMTLRLSYPALKIRALCWVLRRLRAGRRGGVTVVS
jgi:hypothetical protein